MYSALSLAFKYLVYYLNASNGKGHGIHSPFVFEFITRVLNDSTKYDEYKIVESLREQLFTDSRLLMVEDFGAGSAFVQKNKRSIRSIARNAVKPGKYGQLLFRVIKFYQPKSIIELGTSLGITTSYLSHAKPDAKLITLEGAEEIADMALKNFQKLSLKNIELVKGNFDSTLESVLEQISLVDFAFIDGNHRQASTENYFQQLVQRVHNDSILIYDDIHWSREMENAWTTIRNHPATRCSIDLFFIGIVFFRKEFKEKQHFTIRF